MSAEPTYDALLWPLGVYIAGAVILAAALIALSCLLGQKHTAKAADRPYESGIDPTGSARIRFDIKYYLIAMFFVIFDLEAVFIIAWSISLRENGWAGFIEISVFIAILICALIYLWRMGALEAGTRLQRSRDGRP
jgi:NADH-quinone oxidoreductase subunit A